ncbi:MAG: amidohydrolase, partial [Oscillospiraceae bacterium]|nr:amidohydrolase [Oscillospiraceae bacterium]
MDRELLKKKVCDAIDANRDKIYEIGRGIYSNPQLGYKETYASGVVKKTFEELGLKYEDGLGITGVKAKLFENAEG